MPHARPVSATESVDEEKQDSVVAFELVGNGRWDSATRRTYYKQIEITADGKADKFRVGDCVLVLSANEDEPNWPCRIERIWEREDKEIHFEAR